MVSTTAGPRSSSVDPRGQRFAAALTTLVFAVVLVTAPSVVAFVLLAWQLVTFVLGVTRGPGTTPYAALFRTVVRPRIGPPAELEDARPPRFAQGVGLGFTVVALAAYAVGLPVLGIIATAMALAAAFLNAAFGYCLGCEVYLLIKRAGDRRSVQRSEPVEAELT